MRPNRLLPVLVGALLASLGTGCSSSEPSMTAPQPPGGGQERVLDYDAFVAGVAPVLRRKGCDATGDCHGGGIRGSFELSPPTAKDLRFDFEQVSLEIDPLEPASSALLLKPLAEGAGGMPHAYVAFDSTSDPDFQSVLAWIEAGELRP